MSNLLILCIGIPCSGKSTWAKQYIKEHSATKVISTDEIRLEMTGVMDCKAEQNAMIYAEARRRAQQALEENYNVIVDATNVAVEEWLAYKEICKDDTIRIAKVFKTPLEKALSRNRKRDRKVPEEIIRRKHEQLQKNMQFLPFIFNYIF